MRTLIIIAALCFIPHATYAAQMHVKETQNVETLTEPMYNPFIERYVMDELKQLRVDMNALHVDLTKEVVNRELTATTRAVGYATDTVTYFFYLIAGISSVLLLVGWNSIREIKDKALNIADTKVNKVISQYEDRLEKLEAELQNKSEGISTAQRRLSQHQDIHSLWLKAAQEQISSNRLNIYDQILEIDPENTEAMTYKADVALEMDEPQWAINLWHQALLYDAENKHAYYQLAGAYALLKQPHDALFYLEKSIKDAEGIAEEDIIKDPIFESLLNNPEFQKLLQSYQGNHKAQEE